MKDMQHLIQRGGIWYVRVTFQGKAYLRSTGTASKEEARRFRNNFLKALQAGRTAALDDSRIRREEPKEEMATLGDVFDAYMEEVAVRGTPSIRTAQHNVAEFKRILRRALGVDDPDTVSASELKGDLARRYARKVLSVDMGPAELARRRRSARSSLRQARSVFKRNIMGAYRGLTLPPRHQIREFCEEYVCEDPQVERAEFSVEEVRILQAGVQLAEREDPGLYLAWMLAYYLALRAGEIAAARWSWIDATDRGDYEMRICSRPEEGFDPKGYSGWVPVSPDVYITMLKYRRPNDPYIVPGGNHTTRYETVTRGLAAWMRAQGWTRLHCAHELRAYRGQQWEQAYGCEVRRDWMRHATLEVGRKHYTTNHNTTQRALGLAA